MSRTLTTLACKKRSGVGAICRGSGACEGCAREEWEKTSEVRDGLGEPCPSLNQVRVALMTLAHSGDVERDPPLAEDAERRTVRWRRTPELVCAP